MLKEITLEFMDAIKAMEAEEYSSLISTMESIRSASDEQYGLMRLTVGMMFDIAEERMNGTDSKVQEDDGTDSKEETEQ